MLTLYLALIAGDVKAITELSTALFSKKVGECLYADWEHILAFEQYVLNCQIIPAFGRACGVLYYAGVSYEWGY